MPGRVPEPSDQTLKGLFSKLPEKCIVLLEDIDAVGTSRSRNESPDEPAWPGTLSGLLNTIDGVASQEGRVLIMTTNRVEKLDEALVRHGRVDLKAEFPLADAGMTAQVFKYIFAPGGKESGQGVERLATEFASRVPEREFSPAEITGRDYSIPLVASALFNRCCG